MHGKFCPRCFARLLLCRKIPCRKIRIPCQRPQKRLGLVQVITRRSHVKRDQTIGLGRYDRQRPRDNCNIDQYGRSRDQPEQPLYRQAHFEWPQAVQVRQPSLCIMAY